MLKYNGNMKHEILLNLIIMTKLIRGSITVRLTSFLTGFVFDQTSKSVVKSTKAKHLNKKK